nr:MAG TPA: hypothetical protein [Caudoviricetes sp.]DAO55136.1 MAG TPA: hypothetical protein [Caudoviricetes sp.]
MFVAVIAEARFKPCSFLFAFAVDIGAVDLVFYCVAARVGDFVYGHCRLLRLTGRRPYGLAYGLRVSGCVPMARILPPRR